MDRGATSRSSSPTTTSSRGSNDGGQMSPRARWREDPPPRRSIPRRELSPRETAARPGVPQWPVMAGRQRLLTPAALERARELRRDGQTVAAVAAELGVGKRTLQRAFAETNSVPGPLALALTLERPETESALFSAVVRAAQGDWRAAAWVLERAWPERWAHPSSRTPEPEETRPVSKIDELAARRAQRV